MGRSPHYDPNEGKRFFRGLFWAVLFSLPLDAAILFYIFG